MLKQRKSIYTFFSVLNFAFLLLFYSSCKNDLVSPIITQSTNIKIPYYSEDYSLLQSQSALSLSDFMTDGHENYHQYGWNICASLEDNSNNIMSFFIAIEYAESDTTPPYRGGIGFCKAEGEGYKWSGITSTTIEMTTSPWSAKLTNPLLPGWFVKIELTSGLMGSADAEYLLTGDVYDASMKHLTVDVRLRDSFGAINQGYGTTSFYPHYITAAQRAKIMGLPEKTIGAYLTATGDPMSAQGAYYYALPLMNVKQFSIEYDTVTYSGSSGKSWMDYFVKSYTAESIAMQKGSKWNWIAIQLPDFNTAINVLDIKNSVAGGIPYARLYNTESERTRNGARKAAHSWAIDEVTVEPFGEQWTTSTGISYYLQYRIRLKSSTYPGDLTVTMIRKSQAVVLPEGSNYQGLGWVQGTLNGQSINGRCWVEVQPVGL
jgi:hypothetical protein